MPYEFITEVEHYSFVYNIHILCATINEWTPAVGTAGLTGSPVLCCVEASRTALAVRYPWAPGPRGLYCTAHRLPGSTPFPLLAVMQE